MPAIARVRRELEAAAARIGARRAVMLRHRDELGADYASDLAAEALRELDAAHDELRSAEDALNAQAEESMATRLAVEASLNARIRELEELVAQQTARAERYCRACEEAEARDRKKGQALVETAHELRSPLGTIAGWLKMLNESKPSEAVQVRAVSSMTRCVRAIVCIVEDLIDHGRVENDRMVLKLEALDLVRLLSGVVDDLRPLAALKKIRISFVTGRHKLDVRADAWRLQQVFKNLLGNAIKFTPEQGSIAIEIAKADRHAEVAITDTGRGIPRDALREIFTPFVQVGAPGTRHTGLGLGLSITRRLVELHRGGIRADSAGPGMGSTFTVRLPLLGPN